VEASDRTALAAQRRGPKADASARRIEQLNRENVRLRRQLERAEIIIDAQKKAVRGTGAAAGGPDERGRVMRAVADLAVHVG
jgi:hypothetical protein